MVVSKEYDEVSQNDTKDEKTEEPKKKSIEDFARMGRYACIVLLFSEFILLCGSGNMFFMIFAGAKPSLSCVGKDFTITDVCSLDYEKLTNCTIEMEYEFKSVNVEFAYICKETASVKTSISVQMMGVLIGTILTGILSDRYGRLKVLSLSYLFTVIFGLISTFAYDLLTFTIARTLQGPFVGGVIGTFLVYMTEQIPRKHRFFVSTVIAWSSNFIIVILIGYYSGDWRSFERNLLIASSPAFILYWFVFESPRWLVQRGRLQEARTVLLKIEEIDGVKKDKTEEIDALIDAEYEAQLANEKKRKHYTFRHLFHTKQLGRAIVVLSYGTFITSMTNYSLVFNLDKLSGSIFINALILAFIRWTLNLICGILDYQVKCVGRKLVHFVAQASIAFCVALVGMTYILGIDKEYVSVVRVCTILATAFSTQVFITKSVALMEIFPTVVRNQAMSFKSIFSRVGVILAPQLFVLAPNNILPYIFLTVICLVDTLLFQCVLPETKGAYLPESLPDKEEKTEMVEKA